MSGVSLNTWYRLTITVNDATGFKVEIKQRDTGAGYASYTRAMSASLGRSWRFQHFMYTAGTAAYLDNYVEQTTAATTTAYLGNYYECVPGQACTSYYYFNGQRIATRTGVPVIYLHGDMLGSASLATNDTTAAKVSDLRYKPFGEVSYQWGAMPTDKRFTGQRAELGSGLYDYGARFYSPLLGRFISPDTIVQDSTDPQSFNRYAYVRNNPLKYVDQTGHCWGWAGGIDTAICAVAAGAGPPGWLVIGATVVAGLLVVGGVIYVTDKVVASMSVESSNTVLSVSNTEIDRDAGKARPEEAQTAQRVVDELGWTYEGRPGLADDAGGDGKFIDENGTEVIVDYLGSQPSTAKGKVDGPANSLESKLKNSVPSIIIVVDRTHMTAAQKQALDKRVADLKKTTPEKADRIRFVGK